MAPSQAQKGDFLKAAQIVAKPAKHSQRLPEIESKFNDLGSAKTHKIVINQYIEKNQTC
jgi:hypothetical protein